MELVIKEFLSRFPEAEVRYDEPMANHTSFRIGGPVKAMVIPRSEDELICILTLAKESGVRTLVIGNGTNLLVSDKPLNMLVIKTTEGFDTVMADGSILRAGCGILLARLAVFALNQGLTGFEFAHGIPGTLGGAVVMNGGAYGGEMKQVVTSTRALCEDLVIREFKGDENDFGYRHSRYSDSKDIVLSAEISLSPGDPAEIKALMEDLGARRRNSQPLTMPSAGSFFKRPAGGYAGTMIDQCGLKGYSVGGAQVSEKHAGFVVNRGGATFEDVLHLMGHVQDEVYHKFRIMLEPEVRIIK